MEAPICTVDVVLLSLQDASLKVALLRREYAPFADAWALPGGYIHPEQDADAREAALRVLREKAGIEGPYLEQLQTFSGAGRDPRGWSVSVAYYALVEARLVTEADRPDLRLAEACGLTGLPFDHDRIVEAAVARLRSKSSYSTLPVHLCGEVFSLPQLQAVYEAVLGEPLNKVSFRRKMDEFGILEPVAGCLETGKAHRPAQLYRVKPAFRERLSTTGRGLNAGA